MKILLMGESTEKALVDILTKIILYVVLVMAFPSIVDGVLGLGTSIGLSTGVGSINSRIAELAENITAEMNAAKLANTKKVLDEFVNLAENASVARTVETVDGNTISINEIAKFCSDQKVDYNENDLMRILSAAGFDIILENGKKSTMGNEIRKYNAEMANLMTSLRNIDSSKEAQKKGLYQEQMRQYISAYIGQPVEDKDYYDRAKISLESALKSKRKKLSKVKLASGSWNDVKSRLIAIVRVCMSEDEADANIEKINNSDKNFKPIDITQMLRLQPFIPLNGKTAGNVENSSGAIGNNMILSPSAMMKISLLVASIANSSMEESTEKKTLYDYTFGLLFNFLVNIIIIFGLFFCGAYMIIQYIMMICEYYLVSAIAYMLLPFIMWEVTSSYTKNLIKLYVSYFFKIMVMMITIIWAYNTYLDLALYINNIGFTNVLSVLMNTVFTLLITLSFVGEAPKIAQVILTGNPDMSMGEFVKQGAAALGFAKLAQKTVGKAAGAAGKVAGVPVKGAVAGAMMAGAHKGKKSEMEKAKGLQSKADGEVAAARQKQTVAGAALDSARGEQTVAQGHFSTADKSYNDAQKQVDSSQAKYDEAKKAAEGKHGNSKEARAAKAAERQLNDDKAKRDEAYRNRAVEKARLDEKNTAVQKAETEKKSSDEEVRRAEGFQRDANRHAKVVSKMPGARNMMGALVLHGAENSALGRGASRLLGLPETAEGKRSHREQAENYAHGFRDRKLEKLDKKYGGEDSV